MQMATDSRLNNNMAFILLKLSIMMFSIMMLQPIKTMNPLLYFFLSLFLVLLAGSAHSFEREYRSHIESANWQTEEKEKYYCIIKQEIPFYGEAIFKHRSGHDIAFELKSQQLFLHQTMVTILAEPAPWRHETAFLIGQVKLNKGHQPLSIKNEYASRMFYHLENGMMPTLQYRDMVDQKDLIYIAISPMNFRQHLKQFRTCQASLLEYDPDFIKDFKIYFATNKTSLSPRARKNLAYVSKHLKVDQKIKQIRIDAHADDRGRRRFNDKLSQRRAQAVVDYLKSLGVDEKMIVSEAHGERKPEVEGKTAQARARNRRARIQLLYTAPPSAEEEKPLEDDEDDYFPTDKRTVVPNFINLEYLNK